MLDHAWGQEPCTVWRPVCRAFAPISAIGEPATIANRKKVAIYAVILFLSPEISGGAINRRAAIAVAVLGRAL